MPDIDALLNGGGCVVAAGREVCGDTGRELEPLRCAAPRGDAGRLVLTRPDGAVEGRCLRMVLLSPSRSAFARTGPPERKAPIPLRELPDEPAPPGADMLPVRTPPTERPGYPG
mmetsp:Transcript_88350/g.247158  ORF Transcript_88350/g.247158 Transcript_88350/m.247158 type:complete len:114 (+) Transcript_88350:216-557(+)